MKKVSTGERIRFADLRRRSVGGPRGDADSDVMSEQLFVSELMDTTPSSSYEGETVRDAFVYNPRDPSVSDSPLARYDSDGEAADEVVTGTQEGVGKADLIVKEDVPEIPGETQQGSLLAVGLAAVKIGASQHGLAGPLTGARHRDDTLSDGESLMGDPRVDHGTDHAPGGCTAEQLIGSLVSECKSLGLGSELTQGTDKYVLRMADDDWDPDLDFPGLDSSAVITDVGVDQFVLCHQAKVEPMLHITIALHKGLNGPLTGTGAMEAPGAGATMTLEVDFQTPGQEGTHHMSMPIAPNGQVDLVRFRDSGLRSAAVSAAECEFDQLLGMGPSAKEQVPEQVQLPEKEQLPEKVLVPEKVQVPEKVPDQEGAEETAKQTPGQEGAEETVEQIPGQEGAEDTTRQTPGQEGAEETVEQIPDQEGAEEIVKLRNMDTGEDIDLAEIKDRVPPSLDPGELFRTKNLP